MESKKQIIAIGDVHGKIELLRHLIFKSIKFDPSKHILVFLGDYIDRGKNSKEVVKFLIDLRKQYPESVILLKGNHEEIAFEFLTRKEKWELWGMVGGDETVASFDRNLTACKDMLIPFIESLPVYYETATHIFVHGGIEGNKTPKQCREHSLLWNRNVETYKGSKILVVGHTIVKDVVRLSNRVIMCDTGAFSSGILSAINVETGDVYQAESKTKITYKARRRRIEYKENIPAQKAMEAWDRQYPVKPIKSYKVEDAATEVDRKFNEIVKSFA
jgi:serine/threonine protein phosphatase 1